MTENNNKVKSVTSVTSGAAANKTSGPETPEELPKTPAEPSKTSTKTAVEVHDVPDEDEILAIPETQNTEDEDKISEPEQDQTLTGDDLMDASMASEASAVFGQSLSTLDRARLNRIAELEALERAEVVQKAVAEKIIDDEKLLNEAAASKN